MPRKPPVSDDWFATAVEVPRADTPDARTRARKRNRWRIAVLATLILAPIAILSSLAAALSSPAPVVTATDNAAQTSAPGRPEATRALADWLASPANILPGSSTPVWAGATRLPQQVDADGKSVAWRTWVHQFEITTAETVYCAQVSVGFSETLGVQVLGQPALTAQAPTDSAAQMDALWSGTEPASAPDPVLDSVSAWARAYTGGYPAALRLSTGDTDADHAYVPLQVTLKSANVTAAAFLAGDDQNSTDTSRMLVRVRLSLLGAPQDQDATPVNMELDLLVYQASSGSPQVVAWGAVGTGTTLSAYQNAVSASRAPQAGEVQPVPTPAPSATTDGGNR